MEHNAELRPMYSIARCRERDLVEDVGSGARVVHEIRIAAFDDAWVVDMIGRGVFQHDAARFPVQSVMRFSELDTVVTIATLAAKPHAVQAVFKTDIGRVNVSFAMRRCLGIAVRLKHYLKRGYVGAVRNAVTAIQNGGTCNHASSEPI
jgi:hypothetical protein